ncbi:hypothetical protein RirG_044860 [Rhizophagus irregularis DAOM 197198w]|uniref:Uncharacterized protein n=1 Tax=Rhizophagus irregularis (strain DAOM 197198w) TaxID=1432141 RepID=A0A015K6A1_RHIIW|nr:hypothetical protein RirG_044860 [Rhizophagus irregularis DAOM 197198w]
MNISSSLAGPCCCSRGPTYGRIPPIHRTGLHQAHRRDHSQEHGSARLSRLLKSQLTEHTSLDGPMHHADATAQPTGYRSYHAVEEQSLIFQNVLGGKSDYRM